MKILYGFKKTIASVLSAVFLSTNVLFAYTPDSNFWTERRKASRRPSPILLTSLPLTTELTPQLFSPSLSQTVTRSVPKGFLEDHAGLLTALSPAYGTVRKVFLGKKYGPVIVHIQDVHMNAEAQKNIREAVRALIRTGQVGAVALEGATEDIDLQPFVDYPNRRAVEMTADYLLKENKISGPIHAALTVQGKLPRILGIDDPIHYQANVQAYRDSSPKLEETRQWVKGLRSEIEAEKKRVFSPALLAFDKKVTSYREGQGSLGDYVRAFPKPPAMVKQFARALEMERAMDFRRVEAERARLIEALTPKLTKQETDALLAQSLAHRSGQLRYADFYGQLKDLCRRKGVDLTRYSAMDDYVNYVLLADGIDAEKLMGELAEQEKAAYAILAKSADEKALVAKDRRTWLTSKLVDFALTPVEWREYRTEKTPSLATFESFYEEADARDESMARNVASAVPPAASTTATVLVTGGYHAEGMAQFLTAKGFTVISYVPKITKVETTQGSSYLSVFTQEKTPLEKLFEGKKLFLALEPFSKANQFNAMLWTKARQFWLEKSGMTETALKVTSHGRLLDTQGRYMNFSLLLRDGEVVVYFEGKEIVLIDQAGRYQERPVQKFSWTKPLRDIPETLALLVSRYFFDRFNHRHGVMDPAHLAKLFSGIQWIKRATWVGILFLFTEAPLMVNSSIRKLTISLKGETDEHEHSRVTSLWGAKLAEVMFGKKVRVDQVGKIYKVLAPVIGVGVALGFMFAGGFLAIAVAGPTSMGIVAPLLGAVFGFVFVIAHYLLPESWMPESLSRNEISLPKVLIQATAYGLSIFATLGGYAGPDFMMALWGATFTLHAVFDGWGRWVANRIRQLVNHVLYYLLGIDLLIIVIGGFWLVGLNPILESQARQILSSSHGANGLDPLSTLVLIMNNHGLDFFFPAVALSVAHLISILFFVGFSKNLKLAIDQAVKQLYSLRFNVLLLTWAIYTFGFEYLDALSTSPNARGGTADIIDVVASFVGFFLANKFFTRWANEDQVHSLMAKASQTQSHDDLLQLVDGVATLAMDVDSKLNLAAKIFALSPNFLGSRPPFFTPYASKVFAKRAYQIEMARKEHGPPFTILSYGLGDGSRLYERVLFCRAIGIKNPRIIGIDYDSDATNTVKEKLPSVEFVLQDLLQWNEQSPLFQRLTGQVHLVDASFVLHEIYTFGGETKPGEIDDTKGKSAVERLLGITGKLIAQGGSLIIVDGMLQDDTTQYQFELSPLYSDIYELIRNSYKPYQFPAPFKRLEGNKIVVELTQRALGIFIDKATFFKHYRRRAVSEERLEREMKEQLDFWTGDEWVKAFELVGLSTEFIGDCPNPFYLSADNHHVLSVDPRYKIHQSYTLYIATKNGTSGKETIRKQETTEVYLSPVFGKMVVDGWDAITDFLFQDIDRLEKVSPWIGVDGYSGSGKSTALGRKMAEKFAAHNKPFIIIELDWFLTQRSIRKTIMDNFMESDGLVNKSPLRLSDFYFQERAIDVLRKIYDETQGLKPGDSKMITLVGLYDRQTGLCDKTISLRIGYGSAVLVEGVGALSPLFTHSGNSKSLYDIGIFLDIDKVSDTSNILLREYDKQVALRHSPGYIQKRVAIIDRPLVEAHIQNGIQRPHFLIDTRVHDHPQLFTAEQIDGEPIFMIDGLKIPSQTRKNKKLEKVDGGNISDTGGRATGWIGLGSAWVGAQAAWYLGVGRTAGQEKTDFVKDFVQSHAAGAEDGINAAVSVALGLWAFVFFGGHFAALQAIFSPNLLAVFLWGTPVLAFLWPIAFLLSHELKKEALQKHFDITPDLGKAARLFVYYLIPLVLTPLTTAFMGPLGGWALVALSTPFFVHWYIRAAHDRINKEKIHSSNRVIQLNQIGFQLGNSLDLDVGPLFGIDSEEVSVIVGLVQFIVISIPFGLVTIFSLVGSLFQVIRLYGFPKKDLPEGILEINNLGDAFNFLKTNKVLKKDAVYKQKAFGKFLCYSLHGIKLPFTESPLWRDLGSRSQLVNVGDKTIHVVGVPHLFPGPKTHILLAVLKNRAKKLNLPVFVEHYFAEHFGLMGVRTLRDHDVVPWYSAFLLSLGVITQVTSLFSLFWLTPWFEGRVNNMVYPMFNWPGSLTKVLERSKYQADKTLEIMDQTNAKEAVLVVGLGHLHQVARYLSEEASQDSDKSNGDDQAAKSRDVQSDDSVNNRADNGNGSNMAAQRQFASEVISNIGNKPADMGLERYMYNVANDAVKNAVLPKTQTPFAEAMKGTPVLFLDRRSVESRTQRAALEAFLEEMPGTVIFTNADKLTIAGVDVRIRKEAFTSLTTPNNLPTGFIEVSLASLESDLAKIGQLHFFQTAVLKLDTKGVTNPDLTDAAKKSWLLSNLFQLLAPTATLQQKWKNIIEVLTGIATSS